jgi:hypothetical protein
MKLSLAEPLAEPLADPFADPLVDPFIFVSELLNQNILFVYIKLITN